MKQLIVLFPFILLKIFSCENRIVSQSIARLKEKGIVRFDTLKTNVKGNDTIFYPEFNPDSIKGFIEFDTRAEFPGGMDAMIEYIKKNTNYPELALQDSVEGRVFINFIINADGSIGTISILRKVREDIDNECIRVVKGMPKWKHGTFFTKSKKGWYWKSVKGSLTVPITFSLSKNNNAKGIIILPKK